MTDENVSFVEAASRKYREDGLISLLRSGLKVGQTRGRNRAVNSLTAILSKFTVSSPALQDRCRRDGWLGHYGDTRTFTVAEPPSDNYPTEFESLFGQHTTGSRFVGELPNVSLSGPYAIPQTADDRLVLEQFGHRKQLETCLYQTFLDSGIGRGLRWLTHPFGPVRARTEYDVALSMVPRHGRTPTHINYAHWLTEDLPKLRALEHYSERTGFDPIILVPPDPPAWLLKTLSMMGYSDADLVEWNADSAVVNRFIVPELLYVHSSGSVFAPEDRAWVANRLRRRVRPDPDFSPSPYVVVSRQGVDRRRLTNHDELIRALEPLGFESYQPETLSIAEQIQLFSNAEVMVGVTGAGLMNALFMQDGALVEIAPPVEFFGTTWLLIANEQGHKYDFVRGPDIRQHDNPQIDFSAPVDRVRRSVERLLESD